MRDLATIPGLLGACLALCLAACDKPSVSTDSPAASSAGGRVTAATGGEKTSSAEICPGCGKPESECTCHAGHDHTGHDHDHSITPPPAEVTLADGSTVPVIAVAALNANPKAYEGTYAIDGTVGEVFADKGRFMLKDCGVACGDASCSGCAADQQLPVSYDLASMKGELPATAERVHVVAEIKPSTAGGFTLAVKEVRNAASGENVCTCGHDHGKGHGHEDHDHQHEHDHDKAKDGSSPA